MPWQRTALEAAYAIEPLDTLASVPGISPDAPETDPLAGLQRLAVIQPRGLSPADNVALDDWVRAPAVARLQAELAEIMENGAYLLLTRKEYTKPTEPPKYPEQLDKDNTKDECKRAIVELDEQKIAYAMCKGFHRGVGANIQEALNEQYYKQLHHKKTAFNMVMAKEYIKHLDKSGAN